MQEFDPSQSHQSEAPTAEQVPHSGVHHGEQPVVDFDKTPLRDAVERGLVNPTPDSAQELTGQRKKRRGLIIGATATVAGAAIVAGSILGIKAATNAGSEDNAPKPNPNETSLVSDSPAPDAEATTAPATPELSIPERIAKAEIPAGLSTQEFADTLFQRETEWANAGATDDLAMKSVDANESWEVFLPKVAAENTLVYAPALFGPNWRDTPSTVEYVARMEKMNLDVLQIYVSTAWNANEHPENLEPYRYWRTPEDAQLVNDEGTVRHFQFKVMNHNNADKNLADDGVIEKDNGKIVMRLTTKIEDKVEYITLMNEFIQY